MKKDKDKDIYVKKINNDFREVSHIYIYNLKSFEHNSLKIEMKIQELNQQNTFYLFFLKWILLQFVLV